VAHASLLAGAGDAAAHSALLDDAQELQVGDQRLIICDVYMCQMTVEEKDSRRRRRRGALRPAGQCAGAASNSSPT